MRKWINLAETMSRNPVEGSVPIPVFYHGTPMYRYDPSLAQELGTWAHDTPISKVGLQPSNASHLYQASIYLTDEASLAENYAYNNFGEESNVDWVILKIDPSFLKEDALKSDLHQEADMAYDEILAMGFTEDDWEEDRITWWATLKAIGQCRYIANIPPQAISIHKRLPID
jgi:hypothetical protein